MEIRALWSEMKFHVFLQNFFNEKFEKKYKSVKIFQNRIQKIKKIKREGENIWNKKDNFYYLNSSKVPFLFEIISR